LPLHSLQQPYSIPSATFRHLSPPFATFRQP
jgi:hypothetical protein